MARDLMTKTKNRSANATARLIHSRAEQDTGPGTAYRRGMDALSAKQNREAKTMKPEGRKKIKDAKDELRRLTGNEPRVRQGHGAPKGRYLKKEKAKSRRNPTQPHHAPNKPRR
jgi:hypothetical protein